MAALTVALLVPAAGSGARMGGVRKPFIKLAGRPVLEWALAPFLARADVVEVVVALNGSAGAGRPFAKNAHVRTTQGGASRFESVANAFAAVESRADLVAVHDGARPFPSAACIDACIRTAATGVGAVAGIPAVDTIKRTDSRGRIKRTLRRETLWYAQTPQVFPRDPFARSVAHCLAADACPTDDASMLEATGFAVRMIPGSPGNFKLTSPEDVMIAEAYLAQQIG